MKFVGQKGRDWNYWNNIKVERFSYDFEKWLGKCSLFVLSVSGWKDQIMTSLFDVFVLFARFQGHTKIALLTAAGCNQSLIQSHTKRKSLTMA